MKLYRLIILIVLLGSMVKLHAEIVQSNTLLPLEQAIEQAPDGALVIFDIDDSIMTCCDPSLQEANKDRLDKVCQRYSEIMPMSEYNRLYSIALRSREVEVVDNKIYDLLVTLMEKKINTIALTHTRTGSFGVIEKMEDWRIVELGHIGIDFSPLSPFTSELSLKNLKGPLGTPNIKNGIIFTAELDKGKVLEEALKLLPKKPSQIIFVDDRIDNLESVEKICSKLQLPYLGFHYIAMKLRPVKYVDERLLEIQVDTLIREERWITSEEAAELFNDETENN